MRTLQNKSHQKPKSVRTKRIPTGSIISVQNQTNPEANTFQLSGNVLILESKYRVIAHLICNIGIFLDIGYSHDRFFA